MTTELNSWIISSMLQQKDSEQNVIQGPAVSCLLYKAWQKAVYNLIYTIF